MRMFLCPALIDVLVYLVYFAVSYGAGERDFSTAQCAWLSALPALAYMGGSLFLGRLLSRRNARALVTAGAALSALAAVAGLALRSFWPLLAAMALFGCATAVFFNAFQTFMRGESPPGGLARVTGLYTLAWSTGSGLGSLVSGGLYRLGPAALCALALAIGAAAAFLMLRHRERALDAPSSDEHSDPAAGAASVSHASYVRVGWIVIFTAMFVQRPLQTFYPLTAARLGIAPLAAGIPLFLQMLLQGLWGAAMVRRRNWLYRPAVLALWPAAAAALLLAARAADTPALYAVAVASIGLWAGFSYFSAVYYAGNSGNRSFNIGVNEFMVGLGSFTGLLASEWVMRRAGDGSLYVFCAGVLAISAAVQFFFACGPGGGRDNGRA